MTSLGSDGVAFVDLWPQERTHTKANRGKDSSVRGCGRREFSPDEAVCKGIHTVQTARASSKTTVKAEPLPWRSKPVAAGTLRAFLLF